MGQRQKYSLHAHLDAVMKSGKAFGVAVAMKADIQSQRSEFSGADVRVADKAATRCKK